MSKHAPSRATHATSGATALAMVDPSQHPDVLAVQQAIDTEAAASLIHGQADEVRIFRQRDRQPTYLVLHPSDITVDHSYQRDLNPRKVEEIVKAGWDPVAANVLICNMRDDGTIVVINGQHRLAAAQKLAVPEIAALVLDALPYRVEAAEFRRANTSPQRMKVAQIMYADLAAGDPETLEIRQAVERAGFRLALHGYPSGRRALVAVAALKMIFKRGGPDQLTRVLGTSLALWPDDNDARKGHLLLALDAFLARHGDELDRERFQKVFSVQPVAAIEQRSNTHRLLDRTVGPETGWYLGMLDLYNKNMSRHRLQPRGGYPNADLPHKVAYIKPSKQVIQQIIDAYAASDRTLAAREELSTEFGLTRSQVESIVYNEAWRRT